MRIQLHAQTFGGQPLPGTGEVFEGEDAAQVVESMRMDSPFSAAQETGEYCAGVLRRIEGEDAPALPTEGIEAAFLQRLVEDGFATILEV